MSKVCKVTAIVFFVLSVIAAVIQLISYTWGWYSFFLYNYSRFCFQFVFLCNRRNNRTAGGIQFKYI